MLSPISRTRRPKAGHPGRRAPATTRGLGSSRPCLASAGGRRLRDATKRAAEKSLSPFNTVELEGRGDAARAAGLGADTASNDGVACAAGATWQPVARRASESKAERVVVMHSYAEP